jgi:hypothetical protein
LRLSAGKAGAQNSGCPLTVKANLLSQFSFSNDIAHIMKFPELRRLAVLALLLPLFSACKPASQNSSGSGNVPSETKEHHTKGHKKAEKKAKKKSPDKDA